MNEPWLIHLNLSTQMTSIPEIDHLQQIYITASPLFGEAAQVPGEAKAGSQSNKKTRWLPCQKHQDCAGKCLDSSHSCLLMCHIKESGSQGQCIPCPMKCNVKGRSKIKGCPIVCSKPPEVTALDGWHTLSVPIVSPSHPKGSPHQGLSDPRELPLARVLKGKGAVGLVETCLSLGVSRIGCDALARVLEKVSKCVPTCLGLLL